MNNIDKNSLSDNDYRNIIDAFNKEISIITIIDNYKNTKNCIESILKNTSIKFKLILINNDIDNLHTNELLEDYKKFKNVIIIKNENKKGFCENINIGITIAKNDVIILNSDTLVTPRWIQKMIISAYSKEDIGIVSPLLIEFCTPLQTTINNKINKDLAHISRLIENISTNTNFSSPIMSDFCVYIKRETINDIGLFDEKNNEYEGKLNFIKCAIKNNWKNIVNDSIFIYNEKLNTDELNEIIIKSKDYLNKKDFEELNESLIHIQRCLNNFDDNLTKQNLLYITDIHDETLIPENIKELSEKYNIFTLILDKIDVELQLFSNNKFNIVTKMEYNPINPNFKSLNKNYLNLIKTFNIDLIFLKFNETYAFLKNSPFLTPIWLASKINIPIFYGEHSGELIKPLVKIKENRDILLDNIIDENKKGVVYTALFGNYENLLEPKFVNSDLDYICFTDNPNLKSKIWNIKLIDDPNLDNVRKARKVKTLPHQYLKNYDYSIWVDAGLEIIGDVKEFINTYSTGKSFMGNIHSERDCIYDESDLCIRLKKDNDEIINAQIDQYKNEGFPQNWGLIESGVIFRKHDDSKLIKVMEDWYSEILKFSTRDQISLPYVLWKNNYPIDKSRIFIWKNQYFEHYFHKDINSIKNRIYDNAILLLYKYYKNFISNKSLK